MPELKLATSSRQHPKIKRLKRKLGAEGVLGLFNLWCFCIEYRKDGKLSGMTPLDISEAADYPGHEDEFVNVLVDLRLLDAEGGVYLIHGWEEYNLIKERRSNSKSPDLSMSDEINEVLSHYRSIHPTRSKNIKPGSANWKRVKRALKDGNTSKDLINAIDGNKICPWHRNVPAGHSIEYIFRNQSKIEGFIERALNPSQYESDEEQVGHHKGSQQFNDGNQAAGF